MFLNANIHVTDISATFQLYFFRAPVPAAGVQSTVAARAAASTEKTAAPAGQPTEKAAPAQNPPAAAVAAADGGKTAASTADGTKNAAAAAAVPDGGGSAKTENVAKSARR